MALNFKQLKSTVPSFSGAKVGKLTTNSNPKSVTLGKIKILKNSISKPINISKFTKVKIPKLKQISVIKKAIKKNVGY